MVDAVELEGLEPKLTNEGLVVYYLQLGEGPTQVAENLTDAFGGNEYDWYEIVQMNEVHFESIPEAERENKRSDAYRNNPTPVKTMFVVGWYDLDDESNDGVPVIHLADKSLVNAILGGAEPVNSLIVTRESTEFDKWLAANSDQNFLKDLMNSMFGHGTLTGMAPGIQNTLSGLPSSKFEAKAERLRSGVITSQAIIRGESHRVPLVGGKGKMTTLTEKIPAYVIRYPDGESDTIPVSEYQMLMEDDEN